MHVRNNVRSKNLEHKFKKKKKNLQKNIKLLLFFVNNTFFTKDLIFRNFAFGHETNRFLEQIVFLFTSHCLWLQ